MSVKARSYTFTINNYKFSDIQAVVDLDSKYLVFGFEQGEDKKTPHIQGYVQFANTRSFKAIKQLLKRAHIEIAKGTPKQNFDYCIKDGEWYEFGEMPESGKITYEKMQDVMANPKENLHLYHQYRKTYQLIENMSKEEHERKLIAISEDDIWKVAKSCDSVCIYPSEYNSEDAYICNAYSDTAKIIHWIRGFPPTYKNGYEFLKWDPEVVYITYSDAIEKNYINKIFGDFLDL